MAKVMSINVRNKKQFLFVPLPPLGITGCRWSRVVTMRDQLDGNLARVRTPDTAECDAWRAWRDGSWRWGPASASPPPSPSSSSTPPPASSSGSGPAARMMKCEKRKLLCLPEPCTFKCQKISNLISWDAGCALYLHQYLMNDPEVNNNAFIVYRILHAGYVTCHV